MSETEAAPTTASVAVAKPAFTVRDFVDAAQLKKDMAFSNNDLDTAMMEQSSLFAHYGVLSADAQRQVDTIKLLLENTEAAIYKMVRDKMVSDGEKFTESLLDKTVSRHSRVVEMKKALNQAKRVESIGKIAVEGFRHRRDMLIQQGLISREERKGELYLRGKSVQEQTVSDQKERVLENLKNKT